MSKKGLVSAYGVGQPRTSPVYGGYSAGNSSALGGNLGVNYGGTSGGGVAGKDNSCSWCEPKVPYLTTMTDLLSTLESLQSTISMYFPPKDAIAPFSSQLAIQGTMNIALFTRLQWVKLYGPIYSTFDATSVIHINLLKDIYLSLGRDWRTDQWLLDWVQP
jgi:hypothetical protein